MKPKTIADYLDAVYDRRATIAEARQGLFDLFMSCVPDETDTGFNMAQNWNDCREQMIKNLEKLK